MKGYVIVSKRQGKYSHEGTEKVGGDDRSGGGPDTKEAILKAAIDEFSEFGLAGGRVDRISTRAGFNKQALYYHYRDKEGLFEAALAYGYQKFSFANDEWLADVEDPMAAMSDLLDKIFDTVSENKNHISLISEENKLKGRHLYGDVLKSIKGYTDSIKKTIACIVSSGQEKGVMSNNIDVDYLYMCIIGNAIFYFNHSHTLSRIFDKDTLEENNINLYKESFKIFFLSAIGKKS